MSNINIVKTVDPQAIQHANETITLTPAAIARVRRIIEQRGGLGLRLGAKKSGCSGYKYVLDYVDLKQTDDHVFPIDEHLALYVDAASFPLVKGTRIDYVKQGLNESFVFSNPRNQNTCGCGESFGL